MNKTTPFISRVHRTHVVIFVSLLALQGATIALHRLGFQDFYQTVAQVLAPEPEFSIQDQSEQRDTFVPQPNQPPLVTRGSGTR